jgi:hypothetical protein
MLWLETVQLIHHDPTVESAIADPDSGAITSAEEQQLRQAILESPAASETLKRAIDANYKSPFRTQPRHKIESPAAEFEPPKPISRRLQVYAFDPSLSGSFATFAFNRVTLDIP